MQAQDEMMVDRLTIGQVVDQLSAEFPDITHSSLRFLEREGLIAPDRTSGGHRLFPPEQVNRIRTIKLWQRQRLSLDEIRERLERADMLPDLHAIAHDLLDTLVAGDREEAQRIVIQVADVGLPLASIFDGIFVPLLRETGELWASGDISVGQEKELSTAVRDMVIMLSARQRTAEARPQTTVIAACVEGELHELGLRMLTALLRERGLRVYYLGPSVSAEVITERIRARRPAAVILAAHQTERQAALFGTLEAIRALDLPGAAPQIFVGGAGAPSEADLDPASGGTIIKDTDLQTSANLIASSIARRARDNDAG